MRQASEAHTTSNKLVEPFEIHSPLIELEKTVKVPQTTEFKEVSLPKHS